jgi:RHS repeat-associated protein
VTQFLYDGLNPVEKLDGASPPNVTAGMLTGLNIDEYFQRTDSTGSYSFLSDAQNSTLELTDSTGTMQTTYSYDPFGATSINYFQSSNPFQFTGRENDWPNLYPPLYYYRARYYNPMFQRFIGQDPGGFLRDQRNLYGHGANDPLDYRKDLNLYSYAKNNPLNVTDPTGRAAVVCSRHHCDWAGFYECVDKPFLLYPTTPACVQAATLCYEVPSPYTCIPAAAMCGAAFGIVSYCLYKNCH